MSYNIGRNLSRVTLKSFFFSVPSFFYLYLSADGIHKCLHVKSRQTIEKVLKLTNIKKLVNSGGKKYLSKHFFLDKLRRCSF